MRKKQYGLTIVELIVTSMILGLLGLLTVVLFRTGASGWKKMEAQSGLLADYEVLNEKLTREIQRSNFASASKADTPDDTGTTLAFLSAIDDTGQFAINDTNSNYDPLWQKYLVFYWDKPAQRLYLREVKLIAGSPEIDTPGPLENYDDGSGTHDLNYYRTGGRLLMTDVDTCVFELTDFMLTLTIGAKKSRYGDEQPETLNMVNSVNFRN